MKKGKKLSTFLLTILFILAFVGCAESEDFIVYGRFKDNYTTNEFEVFCNWTTINPLLDNKNFEKYGLSPLPVYSFVEAEESINAIALIDNNSKKSSNDNTMFNSAEISYGAQKCNSVESQHHLGERYFTEPMIQIYFYNPNAKRREYEIEPDYILGYRAVYSLDGELALEEGQWFLDEDKDEFCRHYFECMLKIIGKSI